MSEESPKEVRQRKIKQFMSLDVAEDFLLHAIAEWEQPEEQRIKAVQSLLDAAGFDAQATCWPVFGGIWKTPCTGKDGKEATAWLQSLTDHLERGEYWSEVRQIRQALDARRQIGKETERG